jgi:transaldolase
MEIFLDTVYPQAVEKYKHLITGVTTNPGLMANAGVAQDSTLLEIAIVVPTLPLSGEVIYANSIQQVCEDARKIAAIAPNIVVKIPGNIIGLSCIGILKAEGMKLNVTALMTFSQLALAAQQGADYVSQFYCRAKDVGLNSVREINMAREYIDRNNLPAKIIVGSIRSSTDVETVLLTQGHIITINPELLEQSFSHLKTDSSIEEFAKRYEESVAKHGPNVPYPTHS